MNIGKDSLDGGSVPCKTYTGIHMHSKNEDIYIYIRITNGVRTLDFGVRAAEDRPLVHGVDKAAISKVFCMHTVQGSGGVSPLMLDFGSGQTSRN